MKEEELGQWVLLAIICSSLSAGETCTQKHEFASYKRYATENAVPAQPVEKEERVVFIGSSITEGWVGTHPDLFKTDGYIGRGTSDQTSYQFLLRFREDVISLSPVLAAINAGTNDVAENTSAYNEDYTFGNIVSITELAKASKIGVILTSVLPAAGLPWRRKIKDVPQEVQPLNARIEAYAKANRVPFVDYYQLMVMGDNKALSPQYTKDEVHPTEEGYDIMEILTEQAIEKALQLQIESR